MPAGQLSTTFQALADPTRRAILPRLAEEDPTMTEPAKPFPVNFPRLRAI
jgi:DNA-binding transcriptional ArsR family regulator